MSTKYARYLGWTIVHTFCVQDMYIICMQDQILFSSGNDNY